MLTITTTTTTNCVLNNNINKVGLEKQLLNIPPKIIIKFSLSLDVIYRNLQTADETLLKAIMVV